MTDIQKRLLEMLKVFHDICVKEDLRYYLIGGTALGAARHKGFIPWDDDIDVGMPRPDYERLKSIYKTLDLGPYCFEFPGADDFVYPFGKLYDTRTTLIENTRYKTKRGIYIDVFPLDGIGNTYEESLKNLKNIIKKTNLLSTKVCAWRKGRKLFKNLAIIFMRYLPCASMQKLMCEIEELSSEKKYDECEFVANCVGNWYEKEILQRKWLGKPTLYQFEGYEFYCPEKIDECLTAIYGDWRKLPPKEKQISHHDFIELDLNKGYSEQNNK